METQKLSVATAEERDINTRIISNMALLMVGKMTSLFGTFIYNFAIGLYVLKVTGSGVSFAATMLFTMLPRIIIGPFAGVIVDKLDRKKLIVLSDFLSGAVMITLYFVSAYWGLRLSFIYTASVLLATCNTFFAVGLGSSIPNLVDDKRLMKTNSMTQGITSMTNILAPILGGIIFGFVDIRLFLLINAISFILSGISESFLNFNVITKVQHKASAVTNIKSQSIKLWSSLKEGFNYIKTQDKIFALLVFALFINFCISFGLSVVAPYIINTVIGMDPSRYGIIVGAMPVGMLLASLALSVLPEFKSKYKSIAIALSVYALVLLLSGIPGIKALHYLGESLFFFMYIAIYLIMGITVIFINIPISTTIQRETPDEYRGRVVSLLQTMASAITPVGYILAGLLIEVIPAFILPVLSGGIMLVMMTRFVANKTLRQW